jgi:hypothetical protein
MRQDLAEGQGASVASPTPGVELPLADRLAQGQLAERLVALVRSIGADLGDRGTRLALSLAACIGTLAFLGGVDGAITPLPPFDLMAEVDFGKPLSEAIAVPAIFSGGLLFAAASLAFAVAADLRRLPWLFMGAFFAFMGIDELAMVHERLGYLIASDWQIPFIPVALAGGVFWLWALRLMWQSDSQRLFWVGGACAWILAQMLEAVVLHEGPRWPWIGEESLVEETLEMIGSTMFLLALFLLRRRFVDRPFQLRRHHARA